MERGGLDVNDNAELIAATGDARAMMRAVAKGLVRIGLAQPVVVLAIYKHGRYTEEVQATRRWLREAPSRY